MIRFCGFLYPRALFLASHSVDWVIFLWHWRRDLSAKVRNKRRRKRPNRHPEGPPKHSCPPTESAIAPWRRRKCLDEGGLATGDTLLSLSSVPACRDVSAQSRLAEKRSDAGSARRSAPVRRRSPP